MTKIEIDPHSLLTGAHRAGSIGRQLEGIAHRVGGLPLPDGTPPGIGGELKAAASQIGRAGVAMEAQRGWLTTRAQLAALADTPLGGLIHLLCPPLINPFEFPALGFHHLKAPPKAHGVKLSDLPGIAMAALRRPMKNPPGPDFLWKMARDQGERNAGRLYALYGTALGLMRTSAAYEYEHDPIFRAILARYPNAPILRTEKRWHDETMAGLKAAKKDPLGFGKLMLQDLVAYKDWKEGHAQFAMGRNEVDAASLLIPAAKLAQFGKLGRGARITGDLAKVERGTARADAAAAREAEATARTQNASHSTLESRVALGEAMSDAKAARAREAAIDARIDQAHAQAVGAAEGLKETFHEIKTDGPRDVLEKTNSTGQVVSAEHAGEEKERGREHGEKRHGRGH